MREHSSTGAVGLCLCLFATLDVTSSCASNGSTTGPPGDAGRNTGGSTGTGGNGGLTDTGGAGAGGREDAGAAGQTAGSGGSPAGGHGGDAGAAGGVAGRGEPGGAGGTGGVAGRGEPGGAGGSLGGSGGLATGGSTGAGGRPGSGGTLGAGGSGTGGAAGAIAARPPMGWNSWNTFQCNLSETLIKGIADAMVSSGMQAAGYQYVNLDDCWMDGRDSTGKLQWNASKFPSGIPALAAYVHGKGLKLGIYETPNTETCVGIYGGISPSVAVGSLGHETQDAATFASWGVDFLKYDLCQGQRAGFTTMRDALQATGRPIVFSINPGNGQNDLCPPDKCSLNLVSIANMWRIGFDINASWSSVMSLVDQDAALYSYAGPGHWNDPDMLEVGHGLSADEDRSHFSMWAMLAAPLLAGNDIRSMSGATQTVLTNSEIVAVDQDPLGSQGRLVATPATNLQVWAKTLAGTNTRAVALLNRTGASTSITVAWSALGLPAGPASVRDLWLHSDQGMFSGSYTVKAVPSHGVAVLKIVSAP
jgi:alpha-galactosidase